MTIKNWTIPARLENIDQVCLAIRNWLEDQNLRDQQFACELLLREALNNAIIHGSRMDTSRRVEIKFAHVENTLELTIKDEGPGFDWRSLIQKDFVENVKESGRGLKLFQLYANHFEFNETGNQVTLVRNIRQEKTLSLDPDKKEGK